MRGGLPGEGFVLPDGEVAPRHGPAGSVGDGLPLLPQGLVIQTLLHAALILSRVTECEVRCLNGTGRCCPSFLRHVTSLLRWRFKALLSMIGVLLALQRIAGVRLAEALLRTDGISSAELPTRR